MGVINQVINLQKPYRAERRGDGSEPEPALDICVFANGIKCILVKRAYSIEIYEYGTRGNLFLRAPDESVLTKFETGFDGTVMA